ncbi:MAG TPA: putative metal-binding motif-containing protein, partial [Myxococcota bacterium]|nr:putative metal-binding motif-containing protein [Myxococcota bacterium]
MRWLGLLALVAGCAGAPVASEDRDDDGVVAGRDCDDGDSAISPRAPELCDGVDNDCDGVIDDADELADGLLLYHDVDGDGFGDPYAPMLRCELTATWIEDATDCDDLDAEVHLGHAEVCDGVDDDCDGLVDDIDPDLIGAITGYFDGDGDGWGTSIAPDTFCVLLPAWSPIAGDCDDTSPDRFPGAPEMCDGFDDDCDGRADGPRAEGAVHGFRDADGDGHGDPARDMWGCERVEGFVLSADDCDDQEPLAWTGAPERCDQVDNDCDGVVDGEGVLGAVQAFRDADGDGYGDPALYAWGCSYPPGSVADGTDCDDGDDARHPGVAEACDGIDNDCDGEIDGRSA